MSKNKMAILTGILLCLSIFSGCKNSTDTPASNQIVVTYDFDIYGVYPGTEASIVQIKLDKGSDVPLFPAHIKSEYQGQVSIFDWKLKDSDSVFDSSTEVQEDIYLVAVYKVADVTDLGAKQIGDNKILVTWADVPNSVYQISYYEGKDGDVEPVTENIINDNNYIIKNVTEDTEYTISVKRTSTLNDSKLLKDTKDVSITITTSQYSNHSEWLMLMYMDGDNNLNDPIYLDLNEAESGLSKLPEDSSVRVVALWDGWDFKSNNNNEDYSAFDNSIDYAFTTASTRLLELGADSRNLYSGGNFYFEGCKLSPETIDLTSTADWIVDNEVDMASETTLENFLKWAKERYSADHIILQFSNHGGGPRSATNAKKYGRRSMCWDETSSNGSSFLKTSDVSKALKNAGFGASNKIALIMEDVCLGGSLEEAYELKDYAEYYVGSPNNVPGMGMDYISFVSSLKKNATVEEVGCNLIKSYRSNYELSESDWNKFIKDNPDLTDLEISVLNQNASTLSFVDLSKIDAVAEAVSNLAQLIYNDKGTENRIVTDNQNLYFLGEDGKYYDNYGKSPGKNAKLYEMYRWFAVKWWTAYYGDPIYYDGSFGCLKDLGCMCVFMRNYYPASLWSELYSKTNAVTSALSEAIIASWRDGYTAPTYYKIKGETCQNLLGTEDLGLGLTINCSCWVNHQAADGKTYKYQEFADWYKNELAFGKECSSWTDLINLWWGTSN